MKGFDVFITNLKQYTYGNLCGEWVHLPCTKGQMQAVFERNEITENTGYFFTDFDLPISEMNRDFGEYQRIDELNYLAVRMDHLSADAFNKVSEIVKSGVEAFDSPSDYINLIENLDCYSTIPAANEYELGRYLVDENIDKSILEQSVPGIIKIGDYLNYEKIGYDAGISMGGMFGSDSFVTKERNYEMSYEGAVPYDYVVQPENPYKFDYQLLSRLKSDCNYFLGNGNARENVLWAGNVEEQIAKMQELYDKFPSGEKPEWLTQEDINNYSKDMLAARASLMNESEMNM